MCSVTTTQNALHRATLSVFIVYAVEEVILSLWF